MYNLHIQEHPFKSDLTIKEVESDLSLRQAYEQTSPILPIENARFIVEDTIVEDVDFVPSDNSTVYVKLVPAKDSNTWEMIGGVTTAIIGVAFMAAGGWTLALVGAGLFALGTWGAAKAYIDSTKFGDQEAQTLRGGNGSKDVWSPVPVIFGEHFIAPTFAAPDYTTLVSYNSDAKKDIYHLHQLYVLGQTPLIVDNISIGDNLLYERNSMAACRAKITRTSSTRARVEKLTLDGSLVSTFLGSSQRVCFKGFTRPQNNKEFKVVGTGSYYVDIETADDIVDETTSTATVLISALSNAGVYTDVDARIITDGVFTGTPYPELVNEIQVNRELVYGATHPVVVTTPADVRVVEFTLTIPQGLYGLSGNSKTEKSVEADIYVKSVTDENWTFLYTKGFYNYKTPYTRDARWTYDFGVKGQYMFKFVKKTPDLGTDEGINTLNVSSLIVHKVDNANQPLKPVSDLVKDDFTFLALKIKATDQLNGTINNLNCTIRQACRVYDANSTAEHEYDKWVLGYSSNPAAIMVDLLTNEITNRYPIGTDAWDSPETIPIDWDAMAEWYEFCDDIGYTCNGVVTSMSTVKEELGKIATTGRASFVIKDGLYSVVIDKEKLPVQLFTPRNSHDFTAQRNFSEPFDGIRIKFTNKDIGYQSDETTVYPNGSAQRKFDEATLDYVTDTANAKRFGQYYYNVKTLRQEAFTFTTDFEYIVCTAGDRIKLQHDVPLIGLAAARVSSTIISGSSITGILIDEYVTVEAGKTYAVEIRTKTIDGDFTILPPIQLNTSGLPYDEDGFATINILTFQTPQGNTSLFAAGDMLAFGEHSAVTEDLIITNIDCGEDLTATITAVKYDEAIYDLTEFAAWEPVVSDAGNSGRGVSIPSASSRSISNLQVAVANARGSRIFNEDRPTTPYTRGDAWRRGINMYIADVSRGASESFNAADWKLVTSDTFQAVSIDTFGEAFPEHRWYISPGGSEPILYSELFSVLSGETTKSEILNDDDTAWVSDGTVGKLIIPTTTGSDSYALETIKAKTGLNSVSYISGRYGRNGWMGEAFTNIYPLSTNSITLTAGTYVLQCSAGTVGCSYGIASPNEYVDGVFTSHALVFTTEGGTVTFTPTDAENISLTKTDFIPPYYEITYSAGGEEITAEVHAVSGKVDIYNKPNRFLPIAEMYADADNHLVIGLYHDVIRIILTGLGVSVVKDLDISGLAIAGNELDFSLSYEAATHIVTAVVGGATLVFNDGTDAYGESILLEGVISKLYIGRDHTGTHRFNNQILEITYS